MKAEIELVGSTLLFDYMDAQRWQQIERIFQAALEREPHEWAAFLNEVCSGDQALRSEVEAMLSSDEQGCDLLEGNAFEAAAGLLAEDKPELAEGETVGHYTVLGLLGIGGMGQVYLAEDTRLGRKVALKLLPASYTRSESRLRRFQQEARSASALNHPNIVTIYDIWEIEGRHLIATEYIEGESLRQGIKQGSLSAEEALDVSIQVASALWAAHQAGIIHRDIKPENIMVRRDGLIKVLDFGLAKLITTQVAAVEEGTAGVPEDAKAQLAADKKEVEGRNRTKTESGLLMGTLPYMSPEQLKGEQLDARSDIFSLGVVIYEMICGRKPFEAETNTELIASILTREPPPLKEHTLSAASDLCQIIYKTLRKDKEGRYKTTLELLADLNILKGKPVASETQPAVSEQSLSSTSHFSDARTASIAPYIFRQIKAHKVVAVIVLLIGVALALAYTLRRVTGKSPAAFERIKITNVPALDNCSLVAMSGDGNYLAYVIVKSDRQSLWLRDMSNNTDTQIIAPEPFHYHALRISPDAAYIYYGKMGGANPNGAIYRVLLSGGEPAEVTKSPAGDIRFSPDGKRFTFYRKNGDESAIMVANADGSDERVVVARKQPEFLHNSATWSPDGKVIVCGVGASAGSQRLRLIGVNLETGAENTIGSQEWSTVWEMGWLPDGSGLLINAKAVEAEPVQIWHISYPDGQARKVTNDLVDYGSISLAGDGKSLAALQIQERSNVWVVDSNTRQSTPITLHDRHLYRFISLAPDGTIIFPSAATGNREIWVMDQSGKTEKQLTSNGGNNILSSVSPDGRYIVYSSDFAGNGKLHIWRMNIDGSNPIQLTAGEGEFEPRCSPDGQWIVYAGNVAGDSSGGLNLRRLWKIPIDGGEPVRLTERPSVGLDISLDGKLIACRYKEDSGPWKIAVIPFEGGMPIKIFNIQSDPGVPLRWIPDGSGFTYSSRRDGVSNLWAQRINGGPPERLTDFSSERIEVFDWSRDGKLFCSRKYVYYSVVLISEIAQKS